MDEYKVTRRATLSGDVSMEIPAEGPIVVLHASTVTVEDLAQVPPTCPWAEDPFPWKHLDGGYDSLKVEDFGTFLAVATPGFPETPVHLEPENALDLGQRLIAWARAHG